MTAPRRSHGMLVSSREKMWDSKRRFADQFAARASGSYLQAKNGDRLWIYQCTACGGWHLTSKPGRKEMAVTYNFEK